MPTAIAALLLTLALLWAGIDWRWAWLVVPPIGVALALRQWWAVAKPLAADSNLRRLQRVRRWVNAQPSPGAKAALAVASFYLMALGGIGLQSDSSDDAKALLGELGAAVGAGVAVTGIVLLLQVGVAWLAGVLRAVRANQPWPAQTLRPRAAARHSARWLAVCAAWGGIVWLAVTCASSRGSLNLVNNLADQGIQVFNQPRYLQEQLRVSYLFASSGDTPKPAWHQLMRPKSMGEALAQSKHPADRWTYAGELPSPQGSYLDADTQNFDHGLTVFGRRDAQAQNRPELAGLVVHVDPGSPAHKAGVLRGDKLKRYTGEIQLTAGAEVSRQINMPDGRSQSKTITIIAPTVYRKTTVGDVSFLRGQALSSDVPLPKAGDAAAQRPPVDGLYVAVQGFEFRLEKEFRRKLEQAYSLELQTDPQLFLMRDVANVVLDLRSNGGGYLATIQSLVFALLGDQLRKDAFLSRKAVGSFGQDNAKPETQKISWHSGRREDYAPPPFWLRPKRLIVLTSPYTCSAAELFIHGIREQIAPRAQIVVIGESTCGKPYGYSLRQYFGYQHAVVDMATVDAQGQPAYTKGLQPDCTVKDSYKGAVLSDQDELWQAARAYIKTGQCAGEKSAK